MDLALNIARSGLDAQHKRLEITSNNLANSNTIGFKRNQAQFEDLPYEILKEPGSATTQSTNSPSGLSIGTGTRLVSNRKMFSTGSQIQTNKPLDLMINGRGFFQVQIPNGGEFAYTRAGSLQLNEQGQLTLPNGYLIQPPITIPTGAESINISNDGIVSVKTSGSSTEQQVGQIQLTDFLNEDGLQPIGENLYRATSAVGTITTSNPNSNGVGNIVQNALESSNVNIVQEMVDLIEAQRGFEITSKAISAVDQMMQQLERVS